MYILLSVSRPWPPQEDVEYTFSWPPTGTENAINKMVHIYETNNATSEVKTRPAGASAARFLLQLRVNVAAASTTTCHASHRLRCAGASPVCLEGSGAPKKGEKGEIEIAHVSAARASSEGDVSG